MVMCKIVVSFVDCDEGSCEGTTLPQAHLHRAELANIKVSCVVVLTSQHYITCELFSSSTKQMTTAVFLS